MTSREAFRILNDNRYAEIIAEKVADFGRYIRYSSQEEAKKAFSEALYMALCALRTQADAPPNEPLTLEQLREMNGEPVYSPRLQEWGLVAAGGFTITNMVYICDNAGNLRPATVWLACGSIYRRKPEEQSC